jgi:hypothetical protein
VGADVSVSMESLLPEADRRLGADRAILDLYSVYRFYGPAGRGVAPPAGAARPRGGEASALAC